VGTCIDQQKGGVKEDAPTFQESKKGKTGKRGKKEMDHCKFLITQKRLRAYPHPKGTYFTLNRLKRGEKKGKCGKAGELKRERCNKVYRTKDYGITEMSLEANDIQEKGRVSPRGGGIKRKVKRKKLIGRIASAIERGVAMTRYHLGKGIST